MKEFNYYPIKVNKNRQNSPFSLIDIIKIKDFNKHLYIKKILKSLEKEKNQKSNHSNHSNRNNTSSKKEIKNSINYNINYNYTERNNKKEYSNNLINDHSMFLRVNRNEKINYDLQKNKLINNSYSTFNLYVQKNNNNNNLSKLSDYIIKPYKKKTLIMNPYPYKNRIKIKNIKLDLSTPEINHNSNTYTDRTFYKIKKNNVNEDDNFIINLKKAYKENKFVKTIEKKHEKIFDLNDPLKSILKKKENYYKKSNINSKIKNINLSQVKKKIAGKKNMRKNILRRSLTPDKLLNINYQKRLAQALILLLEKYYKIYLLKIKYFFLNILKKFVGIKKIVIKNKTRNKNNSSIYSFYPTEIKEENNDESKNHNSNNFFLTKYGSRKEQILMHQLKNRNDSDLYNTNKSELYRNWSELNKMKEIIERRKKSQSKSQSKSPKKINELKKNENQKLIYQNKKLIYNKSSRNIIKNKKVNISGGYQNCHYYDYNGKIVIVKKISTKDKKINIDIKYMDCMNFKEKKKFRTLKISKDFTIDLIRQSSNKKLIIQRLGNKYFNNKISNKGELNNKNNLGLIKEVEEKSNYEDKNQSKNSNEEINYNYF